MCLKKSVVRKQEIQKLLDVFEDCKEDVDVFRVRMDLLSQADFKQVKLSSKWSNPFLMHGLLAKSFKKSKALKLLYSFRFFLGIVVSGVLPWLNSYACLQLALGVGYIVYIVACLRIDSLDYEVKEAKLCRESKHIDELMDSMKRVINSMMYSNGASSNGH